jgi:hypothetical protein
MVKVTNFVAKPTPKTILWNRAQRRVLAVQKTTERGAFWCNINIGAGMTHWVRAAV